MPPVTNTFAIAVLAANYCNYAILSASGTGSGERKIKDELGRILSEDRFKLQEAQDYGKQPATPLAGRWFIRHRMLLCEVLPICVPCPSSMYMPLVAAHLIKVNLYHKKV
jgi:hypothetical protein